MTALTIWNEKFPDLYLSEADTMFADPPDNIKLGYDECDDGMEVEAYIDFINVVLEKGLEVAKTTYMSFNAKWMTEVGALLQAFKVVHEGLEVKWMIQGFTFGQHNKYDQGNNFRPIVRLRVPDSPLFPDAIRTESWRMKNGDKRANPSGKVPGDVWFSDFLDYARVTGNSSQRRQWHPTQLHEGLVEDCLLMSTPPGGVVYDPFMGTGTTLRVCKANGWTCVTQDMSRKYCEKVAAEHDMKEHDWGWHVRTS